jgi:hypothetical protein
MVVSMSNVQRKALHVTWRDGATIEEEQRLEVLDQRIDRRKLILADDIEERRKIMMRIVRRKRRSEGKT